MKKPLCELCNTRHNSYEPHHFVTPVTKVPPVVTKVEVPVPETVTKVKMGRPRKYKSHAERQAAYRERKDAMRKDVGRKIGQFYAELEESARSEALDSIGPVGADIPFEGLDVEHIQAGEG